ncbi:MAG: MazG-like family protein [Aerococcus sanguinicola]
MNELIKKIEDWAKERGLDKAEPNAQFLKVSEEFGELAQGMAKHKPLQITDSQGDLIVTLVILNMQQRYNGIIDHDLTECLQFAYDEIKDRKGKMVDGVFVKEEDLL